jgi:putative salt-induced outer membrane protein YdiY
MELKIYKSHTFVRLILSIVVIAMLCASASARRKDVVVMKNGDKLTGDVKRLENGVLYVETDYSSGSVPIDWMQVESVHSIAGYQVTLSNGQHLAGTIEKLSPEESPDKDFKVVTNGHEIAVSGADVVTIESQKQSFWRQLTGSVDLSYGFTSGNSQSNFGSNGNSEYRTTAWSSGISYNTSFNGQSGGSKTNLWELTPSGEYFLNRNSTLVGVVDFLHSSQQDLDLRTTVGGGYGHYWKRTNQNVLSSILGTVYTHETFQSGATGPTQQNVEALIGVKYQLFRFTRYILQAQGFVYPGLSDAGRIRATTQTTFTVKLVNNFHSDFSFWDNYDSRPPVNAKKNDLGISSSFGWSF